MTPHAVPSLAVTRRFGFLVAAALAIALAAAPGSAATAGGWAVGSLDSVPAAAAGETVPVGFTVLQHGVMPAELTEDVGIEIHRPDGSVDFFAATNDGTPGHYVATVTFPDTVGSYDWSIRMGWFGSHDLGTIDVTPPSSGGSIWSGVHWVLLAVTMVLAGVAVTDMVVDRRRTRVAIG